MLGRATHARPFRRRDFVLTERLSIALLWRARAARLYIDAMRANVSAALLVAMKQLRACDLVSYHALLALVCRQRELRRK